MQGCLWPMLANDRYPCCTLAAAGHMVHHWTEANELLVLLTEQDIIDAYQALSDNSGKNRRSLAVLRSEFVMISFLEMI